MPALILAFFQFLLTQVVVKFFVFTAFYLLITYVLPEIVQFIGVQTYLDQISNLFNAQTSFIGYLFAVFNIVQGFQIVLTALFVRWTVKRLPFIG